MSQRAHVDVIDTHDHLRDPEIFPDENRSYQEFGADAALKDLYHGWVAIAHAMPNTKTPLTTHATIKAYILSLKDKENFWGVYFCYNGTNILELQSAFADPEVRPYLVGVKIYPALPKAGGGTGSVTTSFSAKQDMYDFSLQSNSPLHQVAKFCSDKKLSLTIHCEDTAEKQRIIDWPGYGTIDDDSEPEFVRNIVLEICEWYPSLKFYIAHVSHADTAGLLIDAWDAWMTNVYAEITPHHFLLTTEEIKKKLGNDAIFGFCHPFVKIHERHRDSLQQLFLDGKYRDQIVYGSDHAPHPEAMKTEKKMGGVPNHQWPQIMLAWMISQGLKMNDPRVTQFFSWNARRNFNDVAGWAERFRQRTGSIIFVSDDFQEGWVSIPGRIHDGAVVNPWERLIPDAVKENWVKVRYN